MDPNHAFADRRTVAALLGTRTPDAINGPPVGQLRLDALEPVDPDLVPPGPRYADAVWIAPYAADTGRGTHLVVLCKRTPADDDVRDAMLRHAESLARAFDRLRLYGHPGRPADFLPLVVDDVAAPEPLPPEAPADAHPYIPLFRLPDIVADLLRTFVLPPTAGNTPVDAEAIRTPAVDNVDFAGLELVPDAWIAPGDRYAQAAWCAPLLPEPGPDGPTGPTHAVFLLRCESVVREDAGQRLQHHGSAIHAAFDTHAAYGHPDHPALVVPVVVYNGKTAWDAAGAVRPPANRGR